MLWVSLLALALCFEDEYDIPAQVRQPFYSLVKSPEPIALPAESRVVNILYHNVPLECVLPSESQKTQPLKALSDPAVVGLARNLLKPLEEVALVQIDDIWAWSVVFNTSIVQFIPSVNLDYSKFRFAPDIFYASTGTAPREALNSSVFASAQPAVVHDKHAMKVVFEGGSWCDVARDYRKTNIYFVCDRQASRGEPRLQSVWEPHACIYEMIWGTSELCGMREFRDPQADRHSIFCGPRVGLDVEVYKQYEALLGQEAEEFLRAPDFADQRDMEFVGKYPKVSL